MNQVSSNRVPSQVGDRFEPAVSDRVLDQIADFSQRHVPVDVFNRCFQCLFRRVRHASAFRVEAL